MLENPYISRLFGFCPYYYSSNTGFSQEFANFGYPLVGVFQKVSWCVARCINAHGAELQDLKMVFVDFNTVLLEEHRTSGFDLNSEHD